MLDRVPIDVDLCPADPEEVAELYVLNRLSRAEAHSFEEHVTGCPMCAEILHSWENYLDVIQKMNWLRIPPQQATELHAGC